MAVTVTHTKTLVSPSSGSEDKVYGVDYVAPNSHQVAGLGTMAEQNAADYIPISQKGAANGVATLGADSLVPEAQLPDLADTYITVVQKGQPNGVAGLDPGGKIPPGQVPDEGLRGHVIQDEGSSLAQRDTINFTGAGVAVTDAGGKTVVTIAGGGGGGSTALDDITAGDADATLTTTGTVTVTSGAGVAGATGKTISIQPGAGNISGTGGIVSVTGGSGGSSGAGGPVTITGGVAGGSNTSGTVTITGGAGFGGGGITIKSGNSSSSISPGDILIESGTAGTNGTTGAIKILGTAATGVGTGSTITITGGTSGASIAGGPVNITGGTGGSTNAMGGALNLRGGTGGGTTGVGGSVNIQPGAPASSGTLGNIQLDGGRGAALATAATGGFVTVPTCAGTPSGTPANVPTGSVPFVYDSTRNDLYFYNSAWVGLRNIPQNSQSAAYTTVAADAGKHLLHPSADTTARIFTIDANATVAYPVGTAITFVNQNSAGVLTIAITSDTMRLAGAGSTGSRTLAANGVATALKITSTEWIISGTGLT